MRALTDLRVGEVLSVGGESSFCTCRAGHGPLTDRASEIVAPETQDKHKMPLHSAASFLSQGDTSGGGKDLKSFWHHSTTEVYLELHGTWLQQAQGPLRQD